MIYNVEYAFTHYNISYVCLWNEIPNRDKRVVEKKETLYHSITNVAKAQGKLFVQVKIGMYVYVCVWGWTIKYNNLLRLRKKALSLFNSKILLNEEKRKKLPRKPNSMFKHLACQQQKLLY